MFYSQKILDHFFNPRNVGTLPDADGVGQIGDPSCGDFLKVWIKVEDDRIVDIKFKCYGCPAAIATASIMTEMARGLTLEEAAGITDEKIAEAAGGLPDWKMHCSNLGAGALRAAIADFLIRELRKRGVENIELE